MSGKLVQSASLYNFGKNGELFDDLYDESEAVSESFNLELDKITLHGIELGFTFVPGAIEVYTVTGCVW